MQLKDLMVACRLDSLDTHWWECIVVATYTAHEHTHLYGYLPDQPEAFRYLGAASSDLEVKDAVHAMQRPHSYFKLAALLVYPLNPVLFWMQGHYVNYELMVGVSPWGKIMAFHNRLQIATDQSHFSLLEASAELEVLQRALAFAQNTELLLQPFYTPAVQKNRHDLVKAEVLL